MINQLIEKIRKTGAPIVAGLDPVLKFVPEHIKQKAYAEYGETMKGAAEAVMEPVSSARMGLPKMGRDSRSRR